MSFLTAPLEYGSATPNAVVIILHGLGADGDDLLPLAQALQPAHPQLRFILPHAPLRHVTLNNGMLMPAWYDISGAGFARERNPEGLAESFKYLQQLIAEQATLRIPIILIGFSQGGALALHTGLRSATPLAGIAALSTYLPPGEYPTAVATLPIFMAHGLYDEVVPLAAASESKALLNGLGYTVNWHEYAIGHQLSPPLVTDLSSWLKMTIRSAASNGI